MNKAFADIDAVQPKEEPLKLSEVFSMMKTIKPGDKVEFDSVGACNTATQANRNTAATIPATATVEKVYPRYVRTRLKGGAAECVSWDSIRHLNGKPWPLYAQECS